jgi:arylsulfatase
MRTAERLSRRAVRSLAALLACACGSPPAADLADRLASAKASCVLIVLDAARASHLGVYGYARDTTPHLDHLAEEGIVFERVVSPAPSTLLSVPAYLTGLRPHTLALRRGSAAGRARSVSEAFAAAGFRTALFAGNPVLRIALADPSIFEHVRIVPPDPRGRSDSQALIEEALAWVETHLGERFFLYVHLLPPHSPYLPTGDAANLFVPERSDLVPDTPTLEAIDRGERAVDADDVAYIEARYDANLRHADAAMGELLAGLEELGALDRALVVVTSDHGESFGRHGRFLHNSTLYNGMLRVPLVFRFPPALGVTPRRVAERVALLDLAPTLIDLFALDPGRETLEGRSLRPSLEHGAPRESRLVVAQGVDAVAGFEGEFKLILRASEDAVEQELYRLSDDPREQRDLARAQPERAEALRTKLVGFLDGSIDPGSLEDAARALSEEERRQLQAIGYLLEQSHRPRP